MHGHNIFTTVLFFIPGVDAAQWSGIKEQGLKKLNKFNGEELVASLTQSIAKLGRLKGEQRFPTQIQKVVSRL